MISKIFFGSNINGVLNQQKLKKSDIMTALLATTMTRILSMTVMIITTIPEIIVLLATTKQVRVQ